MYPCLASSSRNPAGFLISIFSYTIESIHGNLLSRCSLYSPVSNHSTPSTHGCYAALVPF